MLTLTEADNGKRVPAYTSDVIEVRLAENATTGYRWEPDSYDARMLQMIESAASYPESVLGSGGVAIFRFKVLGDGSNVLTFKYGRSWEGAGSIVKRFSVTIESTRQEPD